MVDSFINRWDMNIKLRVGEKVKCSLTGEYYEAYIPRPLPPIPSLELEEIYPLLDQANIALGRLEGMSLILPNPSLFLYMYVRKEAVLSSQIEGTQSTLSDLLLYENNEVPGVPLDDVTEVSSYVAAMDHGLNRLKEGFPLCLRLIKEIHAILLSKGRGKDMQPGEFRRIQNRIGGTKASNAKFVPPPPEKLQECLNLFELFLHDEKHKLPVLIKAALVHHQFETIHPFLDGNGRVGRLLITLILFAEKALSLPLLYLSLYFKTNHQLYYDQLQHVRETGDWEEWIKFFLNGIIQTSSQATETAKSILTLFEQDRLKIEQVGKASASMLIVHNYLQKSPINDTATLVKKCNITLPTVLRSLENLEKLGIVREITGKERNRIFAYSSYITILDKGIETEQII
ncbi:MAG: filamentation induced by cAMP protein Fic [Gammaproteobacteria bacterium]|jgi:Fic family protein|nr:filamentation induced by cAMP protein Fic [Gammaproteobacteria bacterium]